LLYEQPIENVLLTFKRLTSSEILENYLSGLGAYHKGYGFGLGLLSLSMKV
jgi:hypothetical protein